MTRLDTTNVKRKKAFLGPLTSRIRNKAAALAEGSTGRILDAGCGNGLLFAALQHCEEAKCFGLDWSRELLDEAREILRKTHASTAQWVRGDMQHPPLKPHSFDSVFFLNTLLNTPDWATAQQLLQGLMDLCSPGGRLLFDIRNRANPYLRLKYWWHSRKRTFPTQPYDLADVRSVLRANGFVISRIESIGVPLKGVALAYVIEARSIA